MTNYKVPFAIGLMLSLDGCMTARLADFDLIADGDRIDITGVPGWADGTFRIGENHGFVRRFASSDAIGWGQDVKGPPFEGVKVGLGARYGAIAFSLTSVDVGGDLEGQCRYARTEVRDHIAGVDVVAPAQPLVLLCAYQIGGRPAGDLDLHAVAARLRSDGDPRVGSIRFQNMELAIRSTHAIKGTSIGTSKPAGYVLNILDGKPIAAVDLNGFSRRRLVVPRRQPERSAAIVAMLTLALFWDPGDTG